MEAYSAPLNYAQQSILPKAMGNSIDGHERLAAATT